MVSAKDLVHTNMERKNWIGRYPILRKCKLVKIAQFLLCRNQNTNDLRRQTGGGSARRSCFAHSPSS